jgi:hypothetical protein
MAMIEPNTKVLEDGEDVLLETPSDLEYDDLPADQSASDDSVPETPAPPKQSEPAQDEDDIPEQLRGKSSKELAKMYAEAQKAIGRQGHELGQLRSMADAYIRRQLAEKAAAAPKKAEPKPVDDVDFFANPKAAIERAVAEHPEVKRLRDDNVRARAGAELVRRQSAEKTFNTNHPDAPEILADPKFREWVGASKVRQALLHRAHAAYDLDAAEEVFGTWKALNPAAAKAEAAAVAAEKRKSAARAAKVPSGGNPSPKDNGQKVYRRADIIKLMNEDPDRYEALSDEIDAAYREGRVR